MAEKAFSLLEGMFNFFFVEHFPDGLLIMWLLPLCFIWVMLSLSLASRLRLNRQWKVPYTRKVFHFLIFGAAALLQWKVGVPGVFILGWAVTATVAFLLLKGKGFKWYDVLARPSDAPYQGRYIIYPYLATFAGGVLSNLLFPPAAVVAGYLVAGMGDAIGEPVGARFGKHRYKVPSYGSGKEHHRSVEGSMAVSIACLMAFVITSYMAGWVAAPLALLAAMVFATLVEAFSPHGWDNLTSQLAGSFLAAWLLMPIA